MVHQVSFFFRDLQKLKITFIFYSAFKCTSQSTVQKQLKQQRYNTQRDTMHSKINIKDNKHKTVNLIFTIWQYF